MFMDRLLNGGATPLVERMVQFTGARAELIADNVVNVDTPGYQQKDLSLPQFQQMLEKRTQLRDRAAPGTVGFDDLNAQLMNPRSGYLFHDRNNRTIEQLQTDLASNAMRHNMYTELLRKQYEQMTTVLKDHVA